MKPRQSQYQAYQQEISDLLSINEKQKFPKKIDSSPRVVFILGIIRIMDRFFSSSNSDTAAKQHS